MKKALKFVGSRVVAGLLVVVPVYLAGLLLLKAAKTLGRLMHPIAKLLPTWLRSEDLLALVTVATLCFLIGLLLTTRAGRSMWTGVENSIFQKIPGYGTLRSLTQRVAGTCQGEEWKPAMAEIEEALVPAFIIEALDDGRFTVFVPSAPTPFAGTIYVLTPDRVHPLNVPFSHAIRALSRWGSGTRELMAAMELSKPPSGGKIRDAA